MPLLSWYAVPMDVVSITQWLMAIIHKGHLYLRCLLNYSTCPSLKAEGRSIWFKHNQNSDFLVLRTLAWHGETVQDSFMNIGKKDNHIYQNLCAIKKESCYLIFSISFVRHDKGDFSKGKSWKLFQYFLHIPTYVGIWVNYSEAAILTSN